MIRRPSGGRILAGVLWLFWYGLWAFLGVAAGIYIGSASRADLAASLPAILMGTCLFWQLAPILTTDAGASLNARKILLYPIPDGELFIVEVLLRLSTALEMLLVLAGTWIGLALNPAVPAALAALAMALFVSFNVLLSAGLRSLLERLLAIRRVREVVVLAMVTCGALPQLLAATGHARDLKRLLTFRQTILAPWVAASRLALGTEVTAALAVLCVAVAAAYVFGRLQFRRSLRFDVAAARSAGAAGSARWTDPLYRWPAALFSDPLAALVEKELRSLARSPRFRVVFLMGFSFGAVVWWPLTHGGRSAPAGIGYPVMVSGYAMILLAEVVFWNQFGFDRAAARLYFSTPAPFSLALRAKNLVALTFVSAEIASILTVCALLRVPLSLASVAQAILVTLIFALYFLSVGNVSSVYQPRPINPEHSWGRSSAGRFQLYMLLLFPAMAAPVGLAYLVLAYSGSLALFYGILGVDALAGAVCYCFATRAAVAAAESRMEDFLAALSQAAGPFVVE
jgi:ABC-2 type transport system permease protein